MRTRKYEELLPHEFFAEIDRKPIAWVPCGLLEWHGKHQALGLDGVKVYEMCLRAADQAGGIVLPTTWWGPGGNPPKTKAELAETELIPGSIAMDRALCETLFNEIFSSLERVGFKVIVALGGHYPSGDMLQRIARQYALNSTVKIWAGKDPLLIADQGGRGDHGGKWETSLLWYLRPELVSFSKVADTCGGRVEEETFGITGNPRSEASHELGEKWANIAIERLIQIAHDLLEQVNNESPIRECT